MKKIFLAISNKSDFDIIHTTLRDKYSEAELLELNDHTSIVNHLYSEYDILIIDSTFQLTVNKIETMRLIGEIWFIDPTYSGEVGKGPLKTFKNADGLVQWLKIRKLTNSKLGKSKQSSIENNEEGTNNDKKEVTNSVKNSSEQVAGSKEENKKEIAPKIVNDRQKEKSVNEIDVQKKEESEQSEMKTAKGKSQERIEENQHEKKDHENKLIERAADIRKRVFSEASWEKNKTIGVWSPLHRMGVTTFLMNFALYLSKLNVPTAVVESLTEYQIMKTTLKRYGSMPENWVSFVQALHDQSIPVENIKWTYRGVHWLPLDDKDVQFNWDKDILKNYLSNVKYFDVVLVDFPTGKMEQYTLDALHFIDELWVIIDDSYQQILAWKKYIQQIQEEYNLSMKLIFNRNTSISRKEELEKGLELPLIAALPDLTKEIYKNYYETKPLIDSSDVFQQLKIPFKQLATELLGEDYVDNHVNTSIFQRIRSYFEYKTLNLKLFK